MSSETESRVDLPPPGSVVEGPRIREARGASHPIARLGLRLARVALLGVAAAFGAILLFLLPDLLLASPVEIRVFFRHPLVKIAMYAALLLLGPRRLLGAIPRRVREGLGARARRVLARPRVAVVRERTTHVARGALRLVSRALAAPWPGPLSRLDDAAAWVLRGPSAIAIGAACALLFLTWAPQYLTWPWWADTDQFAVSAQFWSEGIRPFRDLRDFDFPGPIYIHYVLGRLFGWGRTAPFYAFDASLVLVLGLALAAWSRRLFGSALPGLASYSVFLCTYLGYNYALVAQRDWRAPFLVLMSLFALEAMPGRAGRAISAAALALSLAFRPHEVVFVPALLSAVDEGARRGDEPWKRSIGPLLEWSALAALALVVAYAPLWTQGLFDDFVRLVAEARERPYNRSRWVIVENVVSQVLQRQDVEFFLLAELVLANAGPAALRRPARTWALALIGVAFYLPISPFPHDYLNQPMQLIQAMSLAIPVAWLLTTRRLSSPLRLAGVGWLIVWCLPPVPPPVCSVSRSLEAIDTLASGEDPAELRPGCFGLFAGPDCGPALYTWDDLRRVFIYLREFTPPETRVFSYLWDYPFPVVNGPTGRLTPVPAGGGYTHLISIEPGLLPRYVDILKRRRDTLVVWVPEHRHPEFPELDEAIRLWYCPEVRFGKIEIWRHRDRGPREPTTPPGRPRPLPTTDAVAVMPGASRDRGHGPGRSKAPGPPAIESSGG